MVKSFLNAFCGGMGRTLGKILVYLAIGLIFFFIYDEAHAAAVYSSLNSCTSTYYNIERVDDNVTYGRTSTSYNFYWNRIVISGTENMTANTYYDITIAMRGTTNISSIFEDPIFYQDSSLCGSHTRVLQISGYGASSQTVTVRVLTGSTLVDYWTLSLPFRYNGSNGINTVTLTKLDLTGSDGIIENANDNTNTIINNDNQNTQDVIDNQNQNTQDVIDNQTQNAQDIIDSQSFNSINELNTLRKSANSNCLNFYDVTLKYGNYSLSSSGALVSSSNKSYYTEQYVNIDFINSSYGSNVTIVNPVQSQSGYRFIFYDNSYNFISSTNIANRSVNIPSNAQYFRFASPVPNSYIYRGSSCITKTDEINNFLNDSSDGDTNIFSTWWDNFDPLSNPLGNVITLPVTLAQKIVGFNSSSCQSINLGNLLGHNLTLTCFTLSSVLPDNATSLINTIDVIMSVSLLVVIIKNTYETIANLISLGGENKIKSHFRLPTPLEFLSSVLNGDGYAEYIEWR